MAMQCIYRQLKQKWQRMKENKDTQSSFVIQNRIIDMIYKHWWKLSQVYLTMHPWFTLPEIEALCVCLCVGLFYTFWNGTTEVRTVKGWIVLEQKNGIWHIYIQQANKKIPLIALDIITCIEAG